MPKSTSTRSAPNRGRSTQQQPNARLSAIAQQDKVRYGRGFRSIGSVAAPIVSRVCDTYGFSHLKILQGWNHIVGLELAAKCRPARIAIDRGKKRTLYVWAHGAVATEIEHCAPMMLERINTTCGHRAVDQIRITQIGKLFAPPPPQSPTKLSVAPDKHRPEAERLVGAVSDSELREALIRLGLAVLTRNAQSLNLTEET